MKNNNMHEIDKKQLEKVTGGDYVLDPNDKTQEERLAELQKRLKEFLNSDQGKNMGLPDNLPGGILGGGFGDCFGNNSTHNSDALQ